MGICQRRVESCRVKDNRMQIHYTVLNDHDREIAGDIEEALHNVIDPELGINIVDLGLLYGIQIDQLGRAILTMTLTTPACPLTDVIEDEIAAVLDGIVDQFRVDWTWTPLWTVNNITDEGRAQMQALGFSF